MRTFEIDPSKPNAEAKLIWSRNQQDRYKDPGRPVERRQGGEDSAAAFGSEAEAAIHAAAIRRLDSAERRRAPPRRAIIRSSIASISQPARPERLFHSPEDKYETVEAVLDDQGTRFITRRESPTEPPNFYLHNGSTEIALTEFKDPAPQLRRITKQLVTYKRADGVPLSIELYLPPDYKPGTRLPAVMWAYPREFNDADTAGQSHGLRASGSPPSPDTPSCSSCWTATRCSKMPRCRWWAPSTS